MSSKHVNIARPVGTVTLGKCSVRKLHESLVTRCEIVSTANDILEKTPISATPIDLELFVVTWWDLGFLQGGTLADIYRRIRELGFMEVPAEAGPLLRLLLPRKRQERGEELLLAMEPLTDRSNNRYVFNVSCDIEGGEWLAARYISTGIIDPRLVEVEGQPSYPRGGWIVCCVK